MNTREREKAAAEWNVILKNHPTFARVFLSQQAILLEASQLGHTVVDRSMCQLLRAGLPVLFEDYWAARCEQRAGEIHLSDQLECITALNRDPGRCFDLDQGWFDDPLAGGRTLPPKPPIPPLRAGR
jgi:hypothetical protein